MQYGRNKLVVALALCSLVAACRQYSASQDCPVVGNSESGIYHVPGDRNYRQMLQQNTGRKDNRVCFQLRAEAEKAGYRRSAAGHKQWWNFLSSRRQGATEPERGGALRMAAREAETAGLKPTSTNVPARAAAGEAEPSVTIRIVQERQKEGKQGGLRP